MTVNRDGVHPSLTCTIFIVSLQIKHSNQQTIFANMHNPADWNDYLYFLKVATCGSLKVAAQQLGVNHSTVFRRINSLEQKLNVRLFDRSKNGYGLTRAGQEIIENVQQVEEQIFTIHRVVQGQDVALGGSLKISTTDTIGYYWLPPYIRAFKALYPDILVDVDIKTRYTVSA